MVKIFRTDDGSHSLKDQRTNETYHSDKGAVQESMHVYVGSGLLHLAAGKTRLSILEMGFGTGLNALLTFLHRPPGLDLHYCAVEAFPLEEQTLRGLHYDRFLQADPDLVQAIQLAPFGTGVNIAPGFTLHKVHSDFGSFRAPQSFDLVYYDAFGPKIQPELWTAERMLQCFDLLHPGGVLVTYCSQGQFRRNLLAAGFQVHKLPGPPGKREITRAVKP